jgi:hypothetical protein
MHEARRIVDGQRTFKAAENALQGPWNRIGNSVPKSDVFRSLKEKPSITIPAAGPFETLHRRSVSNPDPLDFVERDFIRRAVVELCGAGAFVGGASPGRSRSCRRSADRP